jgi:hypothetical protein
LLVRDGVDARRHKRRDPDRPERDDPGHILPAVYGEMLLQICRDYAGLPDPRTLTMTQIRFFYSGLRKELHEATKPKKTGKG